MSMEEGILDGEGVYCPECGYDLRGTMEERCPECGGKFVREELKVSRIPWVHRKAVGRVKGWWRTVWMVMWRPGEVGREVARPVGWRDASRFRWVMVAVAAVLMGAVCAGLYPWADVKNIFWNNLINWGIGTPTTGEMMAWPGCVLWTGPGVIAVVLVGMLVGGGVVSWWVRLWFWMLGGWRRDRASAISCYAAIYWIVLTLLGAMDLGAWVGAKKIGSFPYMAQLGIGSGLASIHVVALIWIGVDLMRILRSATRCGGLGTAMAAVGMPVGAAVLFAGSVGVVNYVLGMLAIMLQSVWG